MSSLVYGCGLQLNRDPSSSSRPDQPPQHRTASKPKYLLTALARSPPTAGSLARQATQDRVNAPGYLSEVQTLAQGQAEIRGLEAKAAKAAEEDAARLNEAARLTP